MPHSMLVLFYLQNRKLELLDAHIFICQAAIKIFVHLNHVISTLRVLLSIYTFSKSQPFLLRFY